jgi:predicted nucleic acid-binding Zn ribbon protein
MPRKTPLPECICLGCGKQFVPKARDRMKYCGRQCFQDVHRKTPEERQAGKREYSRLRSEQKRSGKPKLRCCQCNAEFVQKRPNQVCCSPACCYQKNLADKRKQYTPKLPPFRFCKICNYLFCRITGKKGESNVVVCSERCRKIYVYHRRREYKARRKVRLLGNRCEPYSRFAIFCRDGWICQLCGKAVDRKANPGTDWFPSIDHRIPISKGGADAPDNVQCVHRYCNIIKGNKMMDALTG